MSLTISLLFPTGRYVAATMDRHDEAEWPPHPARLILGLLSSHYRGQQLPAERAALQWLCEQAPPHIVIPKEADCQVQIISGVFVPQNPSEAKDVKHRRKEREFATVTLPDTEASVFFHWPELEPEPEVFTALASLVEKLPRLGHSSSLVVASLSCEAPPVDLVHLAPQSADAISSPDFRLRIPWSGLLESAELAFDADGRQQELIAAYEARDSAKKPLTKFPASERGRYDARHVVSGYVKHSESHSHPSPWEQSIVVLKRSNGTRLGLESTWQIASILHRTILDRWSRNKSLGEVPSWISGHQGGDPANGSAPARHNHLAIFPLPHVGHKHADGHLLGLALALPRPDSRAPGMDAASIRRDARKLLEILFAEDSLELTPQDKAWLWKLEICQDLQPAEALSPARWTPAAECWASVTPIILDKHPKPDLKKDPGAWRESCVAIIRKSCANLGLPEPLEIIPSLHSKFAGAPTSAGFVPPAPRPDRPARFHLHAQILFAHPVIGPLLIGSGRYRGYGLMLPITNLSSP